MNLPQPLLNLINAEYTPHPNRFGVNSLIGPPQIRQLRLRHWNEIERDPLDGVWMLFGRLLHKQMELAAGPNALTEEKLVVDWDEVRRIVGVPDLYTEEGDGTIYDYKFCSVFSTMDGVKPEYEAQLNVYAWLLRKFGFPVNHLRLVAIYRDWSAGKAKFDDKYPPKIQVFDVKPWPLDEVNKYVNSRMALHIANETKGDDELTPCTDEERWHRPGKYAVMKKGGKRAVKLHDDMDAAHAHAAEIGGFVEERSTAYTRCEEYCEVAPFCKQWTKSSDAKLKEAGL